MGGLSPHQPKGGLDMTKEAFRQIVRGIFDKAREVLAKMVKGVVVFAGEALSACETRKAAADIQAQGYLSNLQRQALREPPIIYLDSVQENAILPPEFCGMNTYIKLNNDQAEFVFQHMLKQHALDAESREELATMVAPLVGVPNMVGVVCHAHRKLADTLILPIVNDRKKMNNIPCVTYRYVVEGQLYWGNNQGVVFRYNVHSADDSLMVKQQYDNNEQYVEETAELLKSFGLQIYSIVAKGVYLQIRLKWTES